MEEPTTNDPRLHKNQDAICEKIHVDHDPIESSFRDTPLGNHCEASHGNTFLVLEVCLLISIESLRKGPLDLFGIYRSMCSVVGFRKAQEYGFIIWSISFKGMFGSSNMIQYTVHGSSLLH